MSITGTIGMDSMGGMASMDGMAGTQGTNITNIPNFIRNTLKSREHLIMVGTDIRYAVSYMHEFQPHAC